MSKLRPLGDRVIVRREEPETEINGIVIPEQAQKSTNRGRVVAVGPKVEDINDGDVVVFTNYGITDVDGNGGLLSLKATDILAIIE